jgi:hypothetical protein
MHWSDEHRKFEQEIYRRHCEASGIPWNDGWGCAVHCTCSYDADWAAFLKYYPGHLETCSLELPNFRHQASGFEVRWYKYIGRDNELKNEPADPAAVISECLLSLGVVGRPD